MRTPGGHRVLVVLFGVGLVGCGGPGAGPAAAPPPTPSMPVATAPVATTPAVTAQAHSVDAPPCASAQLRLAPGPPVAEPTGQHSLSLTLTNASGSACALDGYPSVTLTDGAGRPVPFDYWHGGDQVVSGRPAAPVGLAAGGVAYVTVNKYRCDRGDVQRPTSLTLGLPGAPEPLSLPGPATADLSYCGPGDPGSRLAVSPFSPTFEATLAFG